VDYLSVIRRCFRRARQGAVRLSIGTGYYSTKARRKPLIEFAKLWYKTNIAPLNGAAVFVLDNAEPGCSPRWRGYGYSVIRSDANLGKWFELWKKPDPQLGSPLLCGWSMSWLTTALCAYSSHSDFIHI